MKKELPLIYANGYLLIPLGVIRPSFLSDLYESGANSLEDKETLNAVGKACGFPAKYY